MPSVLHKNRVYRLAEDEPSPEAGKFVEDTSKRVGEVQDSFERLLTAHQMLFAPAEDTSTTVATRTSDGAEGYTQAQRDTILSELDKVEDQLEKTIRFYEELDGKVL